MLASQALLKLAVKGPFVMRPYKLLRFYSAKWFTSCYRSWWNLLPGQASPMVEIGERVQVPALGKLLVSVPLI